MQISNEDKKFLELYSDSVYEKPSVTVDAVIFRLIDKDTGNYRKLPEKNFKYILQNANFHLSKINMLLWGLLLT